jgi:leucyl-tRNA synthetase
LGIYEILWCKDLEDAVAIARSHAKVAPYLDGKTIARIIYVPGKILNLVVP